MHHDLAAAQRHSPHGRMAGGGELQEPLRGIIADSTNRTNGILFKCAVEQGIMAHTIAAHFRDTLEDRRTLRGYVVDEVKRTNGQIRFEDAQDVQRQLPDDTWRD